jgi:hypothetical protein
MSTFLKEVVEAGVTIDDLARALASLDGRRDDYDNGKQSDDLCAFGGHYAGYLTEMEEVVRRAIGYASERGPEAWRRTLSARLLLSTAPRRS